MTVAKIIRFDRINFEIFLDDQDADLFCLSWGIVRKKNQFYVKGTTAECGGYLHQRILERKLGRRLVEGEIGDHKDRNTMNNRRNNLRPTTYSQNNANNVGQTNRKHILPHGVYRTTEGRFNTGVSFEGTNYYLGTFDTPDEASTAFRTKHAELWREFSPYFEDNVLFQDLMETLKILSAEASPTLEAFKTDNTKNDIARYGLCLVLEVSELINALPWKMWQRNSSSIEFAVEEFADMLCFIGSIIVLFKRLGVYEYDLAEAYVQKTKENKERFAYYLESTRDTEGT